MNIYISYFQLVFPRVGANKHCENYLCVILPIQVFLGVDLSVSYISSSFVVNDIQIVFFLSVVRHSRAIVAKPTVFVIPVYFSLHAFFPRAIRARIPKWIVKI